MRKKWIKLSIGADVLKHVISAIKIRRAPARHDNVDFQPIITRTSEIKSLSIAVADKGYDNEENHVLVREDLKTYSSIISPRYRYVPIWRTHGSQVQETDETWLSENHCTINVTRMKP